MSLKLLQNKKYILGCSFGPDSMALFDMLQKEGFEFVVCFVNYHTREESDVEEASIKEYCSKHQVKLYIKKDVLYNPNEDGNFEAWARQVRYQFFKQVFDIENAYATLIAHHQDDLLETYIMQKNRRMIIPFYGLKEETVLYDMKIIRPLLGYSKKELLEYCHTNNIPYSIDYTNLEDIHTRNQIRHSIVEHLTLEERTNYINEIININETRKTDIEEGKKTISENILRLEDYYKCHNDMAKTFAIYYFIEKNTSMFDITKGRITEIQKIIDSKKPNIQTKLNDNFFLIKEYDYIKILSSKKMSSQDYSYIIEKPCEFKQGILTLNLLKDTSHRNITSDDYPLTIRTYKSNDVIILKGVKRDVRRLFIDWKMPSRVRSIWPIFVNKDGRIIYIPRYSSDFVADSKSDLIIDLNESE